MGIHFKLHFHELCERGFTTVEDYHEAVLLGNHSGHDYEITDLTEGFMVSVS